MEVDVNVDDDEEEEAVVVDGDAFGSWGFAHAYPPGFGRLSMSESSERTSWGGSC